MQIKTVTDKVLGDLFFPEHDIVISGMIESFGTWEPLEQKWIMDNVHPGSVVYNLGANVGYHSILSSIAQSGSGKVVAVEASKELCQFVEKNCKNKEVTNVEVLNLAITNQNRELVIYYSENNCGDNRVSNPRAGTRSESVESVTINKLIELVGCAPDIIIMDIQGWETQVLNSLDKSVRGIKCLFEFTPNFIIEMGFSVEEEIQKIIDSGWTIQNLNKELVDINQIYKQYLVDPTPEQFFLNLIAER